MQILRARKFFLKVKVYQPKEAINQGKAIENQKIDLNLLLRIYSIKIIYKHKGTLKIWNKKMCYPQELNNKRKLKICLKF